MTFGIVLALFTLIGLVGLISLGWRSKQISRRFPVRSPDDGSVGTLRWMETSGGGELDRLSRLEFRAMALGPSLAVPVEAVARIRPVRKKRISHRVERPDSPFAANVLVECEAMGVDWLINHCRRTYIFAVLRGQQAGYRCDDEILWAACLLHGVGLAGPAAVNLDSGHCFTARSASVAESLARTYDWPDARTERLREAITLHVNPRVSRSRGIEAWLLRYAVGLDVFGIGFGRIYSGAMDRTVARFPLGDQKKALLQLWDAEATQWRGCRAAALDGVLFRFLVKTSPLYREYG